MKNIASLQTVVTLANACELAGAIAKEVLGNDVADMVDGNELKTSVVRTMTLAQIQSQLTTQIGAN